MISLINNFEKMNLGVRFLDDGIKNLNTFLNWFEL
jgi:hypothetical protein